MATMKDLFTYPNDASEPIKYINPTYVAGAINATDIVSGDQVKIKVAGTTDFTAIGSPNNTPGQVFTASGAGTGTGTVYLQQTGLLGRFDKLKNGNLFITTYNGSTSPQLILQDTSKFINYFSSENTSSRELSMYDMYYNALLKGDLGVISGSLGSADTSTPINFTITGHGFIQGELYTATNFNSTLVALNNRDFYVKVIDANTIQLATDSGLTNLVAYNTGEQDTFTADVTTANLANFNLASYTVDDNDRVRVNATSGTMAELDNLQMFVQTIDSDDINLSWDSGGTDLLKFQDVDTDNDIDNVVVGTGSFKVQLQSAEPSHLDHAKIVFDEPASYLATEVEVLDNTQHRVALVSASGNTIFYGSGTENNWATVTYNDTAYASVDEISSADQPCAISEDGKIAMLLMLKHMT